MGKNRFTGFDELASAFSQGKVDFGEENKLVDDENDSFKSKTFSIVCDNVRSIFDDKNYFNNHLETKPKQADEILKNSEMRKLISFIGKQVSLDDFILKIKDDDPFLYNDKVIDGRPREIRYRNILARYNVYESFKHIYKASFVGDNEIDFSGIRVYYFKETVSKIIRILLIDPHHMLAVGQQTYENKMVIYSKDRCNVCLSNL